MRTFFWIFLFFCLFIQTLPVFAQTTPKPQVDLERQIELDELTKSGRRAIDILGKESYGATAPPSPGDDALGQQYILKRKTEYQPFSIFGNTGWNWTSNVALTKNNPQDDNYFLTTTGVSYQPIIRPNLLGEVTAMYQWFRYDRFTEMNFDSFNTGSGLTVGQPTDQYRALFNRADLVRLGYLKIITYDANDPGTINAEIKPFSDYAATYISSSDLETRVKESWETEMAKKTPEKQAEAQQLINEAKAVQDKTSNRDPSTGDGTANSVTTRSYQEFFAYAGGTGSNLNLAAGRSVAGFGKVTMAAEGNINISGEVAGAENFYGIGSNSISVADGGLIEVFTDHHLTGGGTIELSAQNKIEVAGRVQASATPQNYFNKWQKAGTITLNNGNADPDSIAIDITSTGQILALINSASYTKSDAGRSKVELKSAGGKIKVDGLTISGENYGKNIVADYGDLNIVNNGVKGVIDILSGAGLQADILKIGALGTEGVLNIYAGSRMDANTQIKLFGGQLSGGAVIFGGSGNVNLTSPAILVSADKVQVNTGVNVNTGAVAADVYANKRYWTPVQGGDAGSSQLGTWSTTPNNKGAPLNPGGGF